MFMTYCRWKRNGKTVLLPIAFVHLLHIDDSLKCSRYFWRILYIENLTKVKFSYMLIEYE